MNQQELLALLSETESQARQREILEQQRELLDQAFVEQGIQQVEAWTKEGGHAAALQLSDGLVTACTFVEKLSQLSGKALLAKAKALDGGQEWDDAMAIYAEAHRHFEGANDLEGVANCDFGQGRIFSSRGDFDKALACYQQAQMAFETLDIKERVASCMVNQANVHFSRSEYDRALAYSQQAQDVFNELGIKDGAARCLKNQGDVHTSRGEYNSAFACYQKARVAFESLGIKDGVASCLMNQGTAHLYRGEYDAALACYQQAQPIFEELGIKDNVAGCTLNQGLVHSSRGEYKAALVCYQQAQGVFEELGIKDGATFCLMNQGIVYRRRGEYEAALVCYQQAQAVYEELGIKDKATDCMMSRAIVHFFRGEYDAALTFFQAAQAVYDELGIMDKPTFCVMNQGIMHLFCGEYDAALACFQKAQVAYETLGMKDRAADCMMNQGKAYCSRGEYISALAYSKGAQAVFEELGIRDKVADCMMNQGEVYHSRGEYEAALVCYQQAQEVFEELGVKDRAMSVFLGKGDVYRLREEHDVALHCYMQAKEERPIQELWYPETQWNVRYGIAKLYKTAPRALDYYDECIAIIDTLRVRQQTDWTKMSILHDKEEVYADAIRWCLDHKSDTVGYLPKAFNYTERAKARALLDLMDQTQPVLKSENPKVQTRLVLLRQHQTEQQRLREAGQLGEAAELSASIQQDQEELTTLNFEDASLTVGQVRDVEAIQQSLPDDGALVEFYYQGETQVAFLLTKEALHAFPLQLETILPTLPKLRQTIQDHPADSLPEVRAMLAELFRVLFKQSGMWSHLENFKRLILVPHGELHNVPFAALYDQERKQYLIEQKILSVVPSASVLDVCRAKNPQRREHCLWVYAPKTKSDVELSAPEKELEALMAEHGKPPETLSKRFETLEPLTGTAATIDRVTVLLREQQWDVVHFYCHADAHPYNPMLSAIVLSGSSGEAQQMALLRAMDIFNLPLRASLVVLGACQTAVGSLRPGDDIVSLTRAFFRAGTPSVLASLWRVPAHDTAALLEYFYLDENFGWLSGADKAIALQMAQRVILLGKPHPYYWAGFVLYGDWS